VGEVCLATGAFKIFRRKSKMESRWYETFFSGVAVEFWDRVMTPELTRPEVDYLEKALALEPNSRVLDVPCGSGRHSIELARRGHRTTGVDLSEESLALARRSPVDAEWRRSDMRDLPWTSEFDGAFCFGNSFGYLTPSEADEFVGRLARVLKPGGRLVIETGVVAESILPTLLQKRWYRIGDIFYASEARYVPEDSHLDIQYTFIQGAKIDTRPATSYVVTVSELRRMFERAGFEGIALAGGFAGEPYQLGCPRLLISGGKSPS
jgi:SAM-dependent methyltransferase